jgi:SAM-dependent methyltransferase
VRVPQLPAVLYWSHNTYYHRWLLRQVPRHPGRVLDVGCGSGRLACTLAARASHVDAIDLSAVMIERAQARCPDRRNVRWLAGDFLDPEFGLAEDGYDAVTAISSLHHMPLRPALARLASMVDTGGVLVVVGLYRPATVGDYALNVVAVPANGLVGVALALQRRTGKPDDEGMPVREPVDTLAEIRAAAANLLPGAAIRRGLFWRYLLLWRQQPSR